MKINTTKEEIKQYERIKFDTPMQNRDLGWVVRMTSTQKEDLFNRLKAKIENGKDWRHILVEELYKRMRAIIPKVKPFEAVMLTDQKDVLLAMCDEFIKLTQLNKVKKVQQKLGGN